MSTELTAWTRSAEMGDPAEPVRRGVGRVAPAPKGAVWVAPRLKPGRVEPQPPVAPHPEVVVAEVVGRGLARRLRRRRRKCLPSSLWPSQLLSAAKTTFLLYTYSRVLGLVDGHTGWPLANQGVLYLIVGEASSPCRIRNAANLRSSDRSQLAWLPGRRVARSPAGIAPWSALLVGRPHGPAFERAYTPGLRLEKQRPFMKFKDVCRKWTGRRGCRTGYSDLPSQPPQLVGFEHSRLCAILS